MNEASEFSDGEAVPRLIRLAALVVTAWALLALFEVAGRPWAGYVANHRDVVIEVAENSPAARAGLRTGDRVLAMDGQRVDGPGGYAALDRAVVGETRTLRVLRDEAALSLTLRYASAPLSYRVKAWAAILAGLLSMAVSLRAMHRLDTRRTRWLAIVGIGIGLAFLPGPWFDSDPVRYAFSLLRSALVLLAVLGAWRFIALLPPAAASPDARFWPWVPISVLWLLLAARNFIDAELAAWLDTLLLVGVGLVFGGYLVTGTIVFLRKYIRTPREQRGRRGMRAVLWGSLLGLVPGLLGSFTLLGQWAPAGWFFLSLPLAPWAWARAAARIER